MALYHREHAIPPVHSGKLAALQSPLLEEPGERWRYGLGIDWLGLVIEAISGETIDQFCRKEIFEPLGMESTGFTLSKAMTERLVPVFVRDGEGVFQEAPFNLDPPRNPEFFGLGYGLYSTASDYLRFLQMWLNEGILNGARILESKTIRRSLLKDSAHPARRRGTVSDAGACWRSESASRSSTISGLTLHAGRSRSAAPPTCRFMLLGWTPQYSFLV